MLNITSESPSIQTIYDWFTKGRLIVNRRYQRKLVWTLEDKKALIETIQRQYPLPNILLAAKDEKYEIIDGLQRLNAIIGFINTEFATNDNKYFNLSEFPAAKDYLENLGEGYSTDASGATKNVDTVLDRNQVTSYLSYVLPVSIMRDATSVDIDNAFSRINRYGHKLSDQESRQAGAVTPFSNYIRKLSQRIRRDDTPDILDLSKMPEISISTPRGGLNYKIESNNTFWVKQHILNNRDLVTSEDEQYLAELVACILDGRMLKREREALDSLYDDSDRAQEINKKLQEYNPDKLTVEILRCIQIVEDTTNSSDTFESIRDLVVGNKSNPIPAFFNLLMTALHRTIFANKRHIADYRELASRLRKSYKRAQVKTVISADDREEVIQTLCGLIYPATVEGLEKEIYPNADAIQVEDLIKQAIVETSRIELKQGLLSLSSKKREQAIDPTLTKILKTAVAIGNTARMYDGAILIGVADSDSDSKRAKHIDHISPQPILNRPVVGVDREWRYLNISEEDYVHRIRDFILNSPLSNPLKEQLVNEIHLVKIRDLHVVYIRIPGQDTPSKYDDSFYVREGDQTIMVQDDDYARIGRLMTSFG